MMKFRSALFLTALANTAMAASSDPEVHIYNDKRDSCTFSNASKAMSRQSNCANLVLNYIAVPAGTTLDLTKLQDGAADKTTWDYDELEGPLLSIAGNKIAVEGASSAILNADGARWWDGKEDKGKTKPRFFAARELTNSNINKLYIKNTNVQAVSINGVNGLNIDNMTIENADGDSESGPNTDGFDIGDSTGVTITCAKVYNQDDFVAVSSGANITFSGGFCSGSHGLSIGSVGNRDINVVDTAKFLYSQVTQFDNGIHVKTFKGASGKVTDVTYSDIALSNIADYGIIVEQNYDGGDLKGEPASSLPITGLTIKDITGTGAFPSSGYNITIVCGSSGC